MMPPWMHSRWVVVPGVLAIAIGAWNVYVAATANGRIEGRVVDPAGRPIPGAVVTLYNRSFITSEPRDRATTGADGGFRFENNTSHAVQLQAEAPGHQTGPRTSLRLWFRAQDATLAAPLVLTAR
jgi:hypothetical protein